MGPALGPILGFLKAIFVGAIAKSGWIYVLSVNLARVALLAIVAKLTAPRLNLSGRAQTKTFTVRDPIAPQAFIYGEDMLSGPIIFSNMSITRGLFYFFSPSSEELPETPLTPLLKGAGSSTKVFDESFRQKFRQPRFKNPGEPSLKGLFARKS